MIGRERLVELMVIQLPQRRFVTVTGSGGIGKTTVALAVADALRPAYRDGAHLVDFSPITEAALVPSALSSALELPVGSGAPIPSLLAVLRDKEMLLVLGNCEHVVEGAAILADEINRNANGVHILATSRQPLRVPGEHVRRLPPLELPPAVKQITAAHALTFAAVRLFAERASALLDNFEVSDANAPVVALICRRLDGIALAIEFAAARVDTLGVLGVADRLGDRFRLLKRGPRTAHPRHQTLHATFDWSYDLLPKKAQTVLRQVAVFAGQFTSASATAVVGAGKMDEADIADEFTALISASLMIADLAAQPVTYRLLESTRAYALEKLIESGERPRVSRRHAEHFLHLLNQAEAASSTWSNARWVQAHGHQLDNLRVALDWAFSEGDDAELAIDLTIAAVPLWQRLSLREECRSRAAAALARLGDATGDQRRCQEMKLFAAVGGALALRVDSGSTAAWTSALAIAELIGDRDYQLRALRGLWGNSYSAGERGLAQKLAKRFAEVASSSGATVMRPMSDHMAGMNLFYAGELAAARLNIERGLIAYEAMPRQSDVLRFSVDHGVVATANLSKILWLQGFPDQATRMAERSVQLASSSVHDLSLAFALAYCACWTSLETGDFASAERYLTLLAARVSWDPLGQWDVSYRCWTAILKDRQGDPAGAADLLAAALSEIPEGSYRLQHARFLGEWAHALARGGRPAEALEAIGRAIAESDRLEERWFFPELLRLKGEILLAAGGPDAAMSAEEQFRASLDWSRRQQALSWELRAATSLARLSNAQGDTGGAREPLAAVYGRFKEGFATGDLRIAKALLDELA